MAAKSIVHSESIKLATVTMVNRYLVGMTISQISLQSQETNCHEVHESHDISMYKYFTNPSSPIVPKQWAPPNFQTFQNRNLFCGPLWACEVPSILTSSASLLRMCKHGWTPRGFEGGLVGCSESCMESLCEAVPNLASLQNRHRHWLDCGFDLLVSEIGHLIHVPKGEPRLHIQELLN